MGRVKKWTLMDEQSAGEMKELKEDDGSGSGVGRTSHRDPAAEIDPDFRLRSAAPSSFEALPPPPPLPGQALWARDAALSRSGTFRGPRGVAPP